MRAFTGSLNTMFWMVKNELLNHSRLKYHSLCHSMLEDLLGTREFVGDSQPGLLAWGLGLRVGLAPQPSEHNIPSHARPLFPTGTYYVISLVPTFNPRQNFT